MKHLILVGRYGSRKTLYARELAKKAPMPMSETEAERSIIHRLSGLHSTTWDPIVPPFRAPHKTVSVTAMKGRFERGFNVKPGEFSIAHGGTLFLDDFPEFSRVVMNAVCSVMTSGEVVHSRGKCRVTIPANFRLIAAMHECPCGGTKRFRKCECSEDTIARYQARIPKEITDQCTVMHEDDYVPEVKAIVKNEMEDRDD